MADCKVNLSIILPGGTMYSKHLCFKNREEEVNDGGAPRVVVKEVPIEGMTTKEVMNFTYKDKKTGKTFNKPIVIHLRKCIPAKKVLKLSEEAYEEMTSANMPAWYGRHRGKKGLAMWSSLNKTARLEEHLRHLSEAMGGTLGDYEVFGE